MGVGPAADGVFPGPSQGARHRAALCMRCKQLVLNPVNTQMQLGICMKGATKKSTSKTQGYQLDNEYQLASWDPVLKSAIAPHISIYAAESGSSGSTSDGYVR